MAEVNVLDSEFDKMYSDMEKELWPDCSSLSALNFLVKLMLNKWTNKSFDDLLQLLKISHQLDNKVPNSYYDAKMKLRKLGLGYQTIHVCKYDCALFWKENEDLQRCPICKTSRWVERTVKEKNVPHKVLRYFPLKDSLRRLYSSKHTTKDMQWHQRGRSTKDVVMRHPIDGEAWKEFDG